MSETIASSSDAAQSTGVTSGVSAVLGPVGAIAGIATGVFSAVSQAELAKKKQQFEQALATLNATDKSNLNYEILNADTDTQRMKILSDAVARIKQQQITNAGNSGSDSSKQMMMILGSVIVLVVALLLIKKM